MSSGLVEVRVEGIEAALSRINEEVAKVEKLSQAGLWEAGLKIMGASQKRLTAQIYSKGSLPGYRLTGNLRASGYVRAAQETVRPEPGELLASQNEAIPGDALPAIGIELGFTATYALYVHEDMEGRGAKFLEGVILENESKIIDIVKQRSGADG